MGISECSQCGAPLENAHKKCEYCGSLVFVDSIAYITNKENTAISKYISSYQKLLKDDPNSLEGNFGLGICYLKNGVYALYSIFFKKIIDIDPSNAKSYYYYSLSTIAEKGGVSKLKNSEIKEIENMFLMAINIEQDRIYRYALAVLKHNYYTRYRLKMTHPTVDELLDGLDISLIDQNEILKINQII